MVWKERRNSPQCTSTCIEFLMITNKGFQSPSYGRFLIRTSIIINHKPPMCVRLHNTYGVYFCYKYIFYPIKELQVFDHFIPFRSKGFERKQLSFFFNIPNSYTQKFAGIFESFIAESFFFLIF